MATLNVTLNVEEIEHLKQSLDNCKSAIVVVLAELDWGIRRANNLIETLTAIENDYQTLQSNQGKDIL